MRHASADRRWRQWRHNNGGRRRARVQHRRPVADPGTGLDPHGQRQLHDRCEHARARRLAAGCTGRVAVHRIPLGKSPRRAQRHRHHDRKRRRGHRLQDRPCTRRRVTRILFAGCLAAAHPGQRRRRAWPVLWRGHALATGDPRRRGAHRDSRPAHRRPAALRVARADARLRPPFPDRLRTSSSCSMRWPCTNSTRSTGT